MSSVKKVPGSVLGRGDILFISLLVPKAQSAKKPEGRRKSPVSSPSLCSYPFYSFEAKMQTLERRRYRQIKRLGDLDNDRGSGGGIVIPVLSWALLISDRGSQGREKSGKVGQIRVQ